MALARRVQLESMGEYSEGVGYQVRVRVRVRVHALGYQVRLEGRR